MKFMQILEFRTSQIDDLNAHLDSWMIQTEGNRVPHRAVLRQDRNAHDQYQLTVEFSSHEQGMENSNRPEGSRFRICPDT